MRTLFGLVLLAGFSAGSVQAQLPSAKEREDYLAYVVAAAKAEGSLTSDAAMVEMLSTQEQIAASPEYRTGDVSLSELGLRAEADMLRARLSERVQAAMMDNVELLANDKRCYRSDAPVEFCERRNRRLAELAGDNACYHFMLMSIAWKAGDAAAFLRHAKAGADAGYYRSPYADNYAGLHARFSQVPDQVAPSVVFETEGGSRAALMAMAIAAAYAMPPFMGFSEPCSVAEGELREQCLDIALMQLAQTQSPIEVGIAARVVEAIGSPDDVDLAKARRREMEWLQEMILPLLIAGDKGALAGMDEYFETYGSDGEIAAMRALLRAHGIAPMPPADWTRTPAAPAVKS
jgi:hypothetical protein